ncbi:hypothetical protein [Marinobacterium arenosum]|uniref:hypothetical protein n=1 Tax=Marinobacterium arenosum TaxID=2862496 RepID=UPI001C98C016|nr:hypothetical protein [Marinobacterium arenosum]MBY4678854.1 hypothetical protein [Marinobacterium arenosum]
MGKVIAFVAKEIREALPVAVFFLVLFHLIALTKAVVLNDYSITSLRAVGATVGALIVAKAILMVRALPISELQTDKRVVQVLWNTFLYSIVVLVMRVVEEVIPLMSAHGGLLSGLSALYDEVNWPLFWIVALWTAGGLALYSVAAELVNVVGAARMKEIFFGARSDVSEDEH